MLEQQLFTCPRHHGGLRLTIAACATAWRRHRDATAEGRFHSCVGCETGAAHAGEPQPPVIDFTHCCYCGKTTNRLVCRVLCPSCFNRVLEITSGRWRRSAPPGLARRLIGFAVNIEDTP